MSGEQNKIDKIDEELDLLATGLFSIINLTYFHKQLYQIKNTEWIFSLHFKAWGKLMRSNSNTFSTNEFFFNPTSFEEVLDNVDENLQIQLLFHLDLFR